MIVAKYKFNPNTYADLLPVFNNGFTSYTKSDTTNSDGTITRTIESTTLPTRITFGEYVVNDRCKSLLEILDMNASNLTTMSDLFRGCINLTSVACNWNTSQVTNMSGMFNSCNSLTSLNVSNWNTSQVTNMSGMFNSCNSLTSLDVSNWNTSNVTDMSYMFYSCNSLTSLNVSNWNTSNVTNMSYLFNRCSLFTSLNVSKWNTSKVTNMQGVFSECRALTSLDLSNWDVSQVTNMYIMFQNCTSLTSLDLNNWNTSDLTDITATFQNCTSLNHLSISDWNISKVTYMNSLFHGCSSLTSLDLNTWDTSKAIRMHSLFQGCSSLTSLNISNWNTLQATNMSNMFNGCSSLTSLDIINWNTFNVTNMSGMFNSCNSLTSLNVSNWNTSNVTNMSYMFQGCSSLTSLNISNWNTSRVIDINGLFRNCTSLISVGISNLDTSRVTNMCDVFSGCTSIFSINMSNCNTSKVTTYRGIFYNCLQLSTLDISNFDISDGSDIYAMFTECRNLYKINLKYANESTVSKIHENLPDRSSKTKGYILSSVDFTSNKNWQIIKSSHNNFYLPQPLRKIGDVKDRLYWDEDKGHYCIEQMITKINISDYDWWQLDSKADDTDKYDTFILSEFNKNRPYFPTNWGGRIIVSDDSVITLDAIHLRMKYPSSRFNGDVEKFKEYCLSNGVYALLQRYGTDKAITIDLPYLNQKLIFDSYNPSTTIDIPNRPLKASKTYLDSPIARYRYINLQPNAQYNVQFDCKGDNGIKVNLGGTEVTFTPTSEWTRKNLTITTPSELVNDKLSISNVGITSNNIVDNVMLFSEVIAQEPDYIDAIQSIGELQSNGTYKLDISTKYGDRVSTHSIYLPQPLRKIGNIKDRFYWDYDKGHYCIEQNVGQVVLDGSEGWNITGDSSIDRINTMAFRLSDPMMGSVYNIKCDNFITCSRENSCYDTDIEGVEGIGGEPYYLCLGIKKSKLPTQDVAGLRQWLSSNPTTVLYVLVAPNIIDLPEMNKKFSFDNYLPNTSIDVTNLPLQPYGLLLEDDTVRYKSTIEPSTLYTIQFNCLAKSTTNLTLDLGGTRVTVDPIIGVNHVQITTPSELTSDRLFLIGTGIIVNKVIVNKGNMAQYPKYFDGEQSVGELQTDGSYIIRISTDNYTGLWEGDL